MVSMWGVVKELSAGMEISTVVAGTGSPRSIDGLGRLAAGIDIVAEVAELLDIGT
jgi:hypothetical protein